MSTLHTAGLGEKKITLDAYADSQEIYYDLLSNFSAINKKLQDCINCLSKLTGSKIDLH